jgi:hypothetical protein
VAVFERHCFRRGKKKPQRKGEIPFGSWVVKEERSKRGEISGPERK